MRRVADLEEAGAAIENYKRGGRYVSSGALLYVGGFSNSPYLWEVERPSLEAQRVSGGNAHLGGGGGRLTNEGLGVVTELASGDG